MSRIGQEGGPSESQLFQALPGVKAVFATIGYLEDARHARWRMNLVDEDRRAESALAYQEKVRGSPCRWRWSARSSPCW